MDKEMYLKIGRPQNVCVLCGAEIVEAGKHPSAILTPDHADEEDPDMPQRRDYCPACWEQRGEQDFVGFWMARREKPKPRKIQNRKERNARLLSYFDFLLQKGDQEYAQHLYFLAHLLMKYSVFRWVRSEPAGTEGVNERIVFRNVVTDDFVTVESVRLDDERLGAIKKEVDGYLEAAGAEATPE
jgi:hypothetical protein